MEVLESLVYSFFNWLVMVNGISLVWVGSILWLNWCVIWQLKLLVLRVGIDRLLLVIISDLQCILLVLVCRWQLVLLWVIFLIEVFSRIFVLVLVYLCSSILRMLLDLLLQNSWLSFFLWYGIWCLVIRLMKFYWVQWVSVDLQKCGLCERKLVGLVYRLVKLQCLLLDMRIFLLVLLVWLSICMWCLCLVVVIVYISLVVLVLMISIFVFVIVLFCLLEMVCILFEVVVGCWSF